jgi:hypothetical protein
MSDIRNRHQQIQTFGPDHRQCQPGLTWGHHGSEGLDSREEGVASPSSAGRIVAPP